MELDNAILFGHDRKSRYDFKSNICVSELLLNNKDLFAIGTLYDTLRDLEFHRYDKECQNSLEVADVLDQRRVAYCFAAHIRDRQVEEFGLHSGDCVCLSATCCRCMSEALYSSAMEVYQEWQIIIEKEQIICTNHAVKLLEILFSTEHLWYQCNHLFNLSYNVPGSNYQDIEKQRDELWDNLWDTEWCYHYWKKLSLEEKEYCHQRAIRFRAYFNNCPVVEGVPWW